MDENTQELGAGITGKHQRKFMSFTKNSENVEGTYIPLFLFLIAFYLISFFYIVGQLVQFESMYSSGEIFSANMAELVTRTKTIEILLYANIIINLLVVYYFFKTVYIRVAGAIAAIVAQLRLVRAGKFSSLRKLRDKDELVKIMDEVHELAHDLEKRDYR